MKKVLRKSTHVIYRRGKNMHSLWKSNIFFFFEFPDNKIVRNTISVKYENRNFRVLVVNVFFLLLLA